MVNNPIAYEFEVGKFKASSRNLLAVLDDDSGCLIPCVKVDGITFEGELAVKLDGSARGSTNDSVFLYVQDSVTPANNKLLEASVKGLLVDIGSAQIHVELNPAEDGVQIYGSNSTANPVKTNVSEQLEVDVVSTPVGFDGSNYHFDLKVDSTLPSALQHKTGVTGAAVALQLEDKTLYRGLVLTNTHATEVLYVGITGVNASTGYPLNPGESLPLVLNNSNIVYIYSTLASAYSWVGS